MQEVLFSHDDFLKESYCKTKKFHQTENQLCKQDSQNHSNDKLSNNDTVFMRQNNTLWYV